MFLHALNAFEGDTRGKIPRITYSDKEDLLFEEVWTPLAALYVERIKAPETVVEADE